MRFCFAATLAIFALTTVAQAQSGITYTTIDPFGSQNMVVQGVSDLGEIVGTYTDPSTGSVLGFEGTPLSPVPETSMTVSFGLLLALGLSGVVAARKKASTA